jgi:chromosome segregation ATPase
MITWRFGIVQEKIAGSLESEVQSLRARLHEADAEARSMNAKLVSAQQVSLAFVGGLSIIRTFRHLALRHDTQEHGAMHQELRSATERCEWLEESLERATASAAVEQDVRSKLLSDEMAQLRKRLSAQANRMVEKEQCVVQLQEQLAELKQQALVAGHEVDAAQSRIADLELELESKTHELQAGELKVADYGKRLAADLVRKEDQLKSLQASMKQLETRHAEQLALALGAHRQESEAEMQELKHHLVEMEQEVRLQPNVVPWPAPFGVCFVCVQCKGTLDWIV